jgi:hypothetical protein
MRRATSSMLRRSERGAGAVVLLLAVIGLGLVATASVTAFTGIHYAQYGVKYDCGSVASPRDPRNLAPKRALVPPRLNTAHDQCVDLRSDRSSRAIVLLVAGSVVLLAALSAPAVTRRAQRIDKRRRARNS